MVTTAANQVVRHLRRILAQEDCGLTDGELLARFIEDRDKAAIAALIKRHGRLVWGVCRRLLNHHDAEDAFQATFLVLCRKAASIRHREMLASWLYGVAYQTGLRARRTATRRRERERQVVDMPELAVVEPDLWNDLRPLLDQELSRLPEDYRVVLLLCDLEGKTRKEVARQVGIPEGSVASRLARARALLAKRLTQRGVVISGGSVAAVLSAGSASASAPPALVASTIKAASLLAAGQAAGVVSVKVAALTEGVLKAMLYIKLRAAALVVLILGFVATGATLFASRTAAGQDDKKPAAEKPVEPTAKQEKKKEKDKEAFTAWGKEVGGLQAGLGFRPGERRAYHLGEAVTLVLRVRNVGKEEAKFLLRTLLQAPSVKYGDGGTLTFGFWGRLGIPTYEEVTLLPGKEIELQELKFELKPASEGKPIYGVLCGTGTFRITYVPDLSRRSDPEPNLRSTGNLEVEVKEPEKKQEKQPMTKEEKLRVLIDKVLAAHGGEDKLNKLQFTMTVKDGKGVTQQYFVQPPRNFRWEQTYPDRPKLIVILNITGQHWYIEGKDGKWRAPLGTIPPLEELLVSAKFFGPREVLKLKYAEPKVDALLDKEIKIKKDADAKVALLDEEIKVDGRAAVGVEVIRKGGKLRMYFDKETHMLLKSGALTYSDYKKFDGIPIAQNVNDGNYGSVRQVTDFRAVDKFDAKLFERP